jgi:hypothetical protein
VQVMNEKLYLEEVPGKPKESSWRARFRTSWAPGSPSEIARLEEDGDLVFIGNGFAFQTPWAVWP